MTRRFAFVLMCLVALGGFVPPSLHADDSVLGDLAFITSANPLSAASQPSSAKPSSARSRGVSAIATGLIFCYQRLVSSQGTDVCVFTPSCSHYSSDAFRRFGLIEGGLMTFDRLQRCHPLGSRYYLVDEQTGKCIDPVEENRPNAR